MAKKMGQMVTKKTMQRSIDPMRGPGSKGAPQRGSSQGPGKAGAPVMKVRQVK